MKKSTIVSDMNGIVFSFDKNFGIKESEEAYFNILREYPNGEDLIYEYTDGDINDSLVTEARVMDDVVGTDKFIINKDAVKGLYESSRNHKVIFVSLSKIETTRKILKEATSYLTVDKQNDFLDSVGIYNMNDYGSKKDSNAWKKVFEEQGDIVAIYEDKPANLDAAKKAAEELGSKPIASTVYKKALQSQKVSIGHSTLRDEPSGSDSKSGA